MRDHADDDPNLVVRGRSVAAVLILSMVASRPALAEQPSPRGAIASPAGAKAAMEFKRSGTQPSQKGPAEYFTGTVRIDPLFQAHDPARASGAYVTFEPRARSAWHTHPLGQLLIATSGAGRVQQWGGPVEEIRAGDVVWTPPGVKHWHGAAPTTAMTHLAIQEALNGKAVDWMENVTDEQYGAASDHSSGPTASRQQDELAMVAPALARYAGVVTGDLWKRPDLSPRDRSLVTVAALIARRQTTEMPHYFDLALDSGVTPGELSEVITHLSFYSGWPNGMAAAAVARDVFGRRGVRADQLPAASGDLLPLDKATEAQRAAKVEQDFGSVAPGVVKYTADILFRDLWLRPGLAPRDRSLVTVSALVASGQVAQVTYHLNRAMDAGLTRAQASEMLTQLAFYAGWPSVFSAMPVVKDVFEKRSK
jgi:4-carboxymuconolactone decarboxylase